MEGRQCCGSDLKTDPVRLQDFANSDPDFTLDLKLATQKDGNFVSQTFEIGR